MNIVFTLSFLIFCVARLQGKPQRECNNTYQFECEDNTCISTARVCDGNPDCRNGEDELNCGRSSCKTLNSSSVLANGYLCRRSCDPRSRQPCSASLKRCLCDDECGYSCLNPATVCPAAVPIVRNAIGHQIIRFQGGIRVQVHPGSAPRYRDMVRYECRQGMKLVGPLLRCTSKKSWSTKLPRCVEVVDYCLNVHCQNGGRCISLQDNYLCECTPRYSGRHCETEVKCTNPVPPPRAYLLDEKEFWIPGESATFGCLDGFKLFGNQTSICNRNAKWIEGNIECIRNTCRLDTFILRDGIEVRGYTPLSLYLKTFQVGDAVTLECSDGGQVLTGGSRFDPPTIQCDYAGIWTPGYDGAYCGDVPRSSGCSLPEIPNLMEIELPPSPEVFEVGETLHPTCGLDHTLLGPDSIICRDDGTWSTIPQCVERDIECQISLMELSDGLLVEGQRQNIASYGAGENVNISCSNPNKRSFSREMQRLVDVTTCSRSGHWEPFIEDLECVQVCRTPSFVESGMMILNSQADLFFPNETLYPECPPNHRHSGSNQIKCLEDGSWTDRVSCEPVGCWISSVNLDDTISIMGHSGESLTGVEFAIGHELQIICEDDTNILGVGFNATITCRGLNVWSDDYTKHACVSGMTCLGRCLSSDEPCACDFGCESRGNCCPDFLEYCEK